MSQLTRTNLLSKYGTTGSQFPDNITGLITELIMRTFGQDLCDSFVSNVNDLQKKATATGTNTYAVAGGISAYADGFSLIVKFTNASSGVCTLNVNTQGAKKIYTNPTTQATTGSITALQTYLLVYDSALDTGTGGFALIGGAGSGGGTWGSILGTLSDQTDLQTALDLKATLASPTFTGVPAAPTAAGGTNTTQLATTAFVQTAADAKVVDSIADSDTTHAPSRNAVFDALALRQPLDSDLTDIAAITPTNDDILQRKAGAWTNRTIAQVKTDLALITQVITNGVTTTAPSEDAVFDALAIKQPLDADLSAIAGLTSAADKIPYFTGSATAALLTRDIDGTLAANSDTVLATQKAVKTYVDGLVSGNKAQFALVTSMRNFYNY